METIYTRDMNDGRAIFVFGSNLAGRHGKGAAREAVLNWGAVSGLRGAIGRSGQAYAIPTKDHVLLVLPLSEVAPHVCNFLEYAMDHPELDFLVTRVGCGLAGHSDYVMAPMFKPPGSDIPSNIKLPKEWVEVLDGSDESNWAWDVSSGDVV